MKKIFYSNEKKIHLNLKAYRSQKDILMTIIQVCRLILLGKFKQIEESEFNKMLSSPDEEMVKIYVIQFNTIKRLFIQTERQIQSFLFPFNVVENEEITLKYHYFNDSYVLENTMLNFIERIIDVKRDQDIVTLDLAYEYFADEYEPIKKENENDSIYWPVDVLQQCISTLLQSDLGYMRYDDDTDIPAEKHTSKPPNIHPDIHFDLYWNKETALKIGVNGQRKLSVKDIVEFVDPDRKCWMVQ